jgi:hypothetical protein
MAKDGPTAKGPDNNKRLMVLEAGVSTLAVALLANGFKVEEGGDPIEAAIVAIKGQASKIDELEEAAKVGSDNATAGEIAAIARAEAAEKALAEANDELEEMRNDVADLEGKIANLGAADELEAPIAVAPRERPEGAHDFGPTFGMSTARELAELIEEGGDFEISFSNGKHEIVELEPVKIKAADLRGKSGRFELAHPIFVRGGQVREEIDGAALVKSGVQIDYCQFPAPVAIEPRQERRFERAIAFGTTPAPEPVEG